MNSSEYIEMERKRIRMAKKKEKGRTKLPGTDEESEQPASKESELEE